MTQPTTSSTTPPTAASTTAATARPTTRSGAAVPPGTGGGPARLADAGMATAEYAVATLAAVGFAGLLFAVLRSGEVQQMLTDLIRSALGTP